MVAKAMGDPTKIVKMDPPEAKTELWIYRNYTPTGGKGHFWYDPFTYESSKLLSAATTDFSRPRTGDASSTPDPVVSPAGGTPTYNLMVLFTQGKVTEVGLKAN